MKSHFKKYIHSIAISNSLDNTLVNRKPSKVLYISVITEHDLDFHGTNWMNLNYRVRMAPININYKFE